jgi:hypothetical protein
MRVRSQDLWEFSGIVDWMLSGDGQGGKFGAITSMIHHWATVFLEHSITFLTLGESRTKAEFASSLC